MEEKPKGGLEMKTIKIDMERLKRDLIPVRVDLVSIIADLDRVADKYGLSIDNLVEILEQETRGLEIGLYYKA